MLSRETAIGVVAAVLAPAAMAFDHLVPGDPGGFVVGSVVSLVLAVALFGWLVPRWTRTPERGANAGLACSVLAVVPGIALGWLGVPFTSPAAASRSASAPANADGADAAPVPSSSRPRSSFSSASPTPSAARMSPVS